MPTRWLSQTNIIAVRVHNQAAMGGVWKPVYLVATDRSLDAVHPEIIKQEMDNI